MYTPYTKRQIPNRRVNSTLRSLDSLQLPLVINSFDIVGLPNACQGCDFSHVRTACVSATLDPKATMSFVETRVEVMLCLYRVTISMLT